MKFERVVMCVVVSIVVAFAVGTAGAAGTKGAADSASKAKTLPSGAKPHGHPGSALPGMKAGAPRANAAHDTLSAAELKKLKLAPAPRALKGKAPRVLAVLLDVHHQVFGAFHEREVVRMKDEFRIGDSEFTGRIIEFVPDWTMGLETFKVYSRSNEPNNPGFRIVVREKGVVRDTAWAFLHMPPHFARNSMLSFKVLRIEFADHAPVPNTAADSTTKSAMTPDSTRARGRKP